MKNNSCFAVALVLFIDLAHFNQIRSTPSHLIKRKVQKVCHKTMSNEKGTQE